MVSRPDPGHRPGAGVRSDRAVPWLPLLQISIGSALLVLFLVMLNRSQEQSRNLERLEQRLQKLERVRALERTSALEEQLRKMLERMQGLEASNQRLAQQEASLQSLLEELQRLGPSPELALPSPAPVAPQAPQRGAPPAAPSPPPLGMQRPSAGENF